MMSGSLEVGQLFTPFQIGSLKLPNRIVMAPMTRAFSPDGIPGEDVASYYRKRAEHGTGLVITEGTWIPEEHAPNDPNVPRFHGTDALAGWKRVLSEVKGAGGRIVPQLWHVGITPKTDIGELYGEQREATPQFGPSGIMSADLRLGEEMTLRQIEDTAQAYVDAAIAAFNMGFDGVELHGAHGYLIDQFFWHVTNLRPPPYGGSIADRTRFACEIIAGIRKATSADFPIILRMSQWKIVDYSARLASTPGEWEQFLAPLASAGVDAFHISQRRFWEPAFEGSDLSLAGWTKSLTDKAVITVGSVTLLKDMFESMVTGKEMAEATSLDELLRRFENGEFDLVAVGRAMITNPDWTKIVREGRLQELRSFEASQLTSLT